MLKSNRLKPARLLAQSKLQIRIKKRILLTMQNKEEKMCAVFWTKKINVTYYWTSKKYMLNKCGLLKHI